MCDPITIAGIALTVGSTVANTIAQNKVQAARNNAMAAERIPIASDHAGFEYKDVLKRQLSDWGFEVLDLGTNSQDSVDYPDYAQLVAEAIRTDRKQSRLPTFDTAVDLHRFLDTIRQS